MTTHLVEFRQEGQVALLLRGDAVGGERVEARQLGVDDASVVPLATCTSRGRHRRNGGFGVECILHDVRFPGRELVGRIVFGVLAVRRLPVAHAHLGLQRVTPKHPRADYRGTEPVHLESKADCLLALLPIHHRPGRVGRYGEAERRGGGAQGLLERGDVLGRGPLRDRLQLRRSAMPPPLVPKSNQRRREHDGIVVLEYLVVLDAVGREADELEEVLRGLHLVAQRSALDNWVFVIE